MIYMNCSRLKIEEITDSLLPSRHSQYWSATRLCFVCRIAKSMSIRCFRLKGSASWLVFYVMHCSAFSIAYCALSLLCLSLLESPSSETPRET